MPTTKSSFQIRGRFLTALALRIDSDADSETFYKRLDEKLRLTPQFFNGAPVVLDLTNAHDFAQIDSLRVLVANLRQRKLRVFGVQDPTRMSEEALQELGLIPVSAGKDAPLQNETTSRRRPRAERPGGENKVVHAPVRSGQMVVCERGDLTVIGSVASGAELVAGGNIHVYGTLRGRAMAGAHGDETARILCQRFNPELVAIAGLYKTSETFEDAKLNRCTHIYLKDERLHVEVIG